jgi:hypothetical protein
MATIADRTALGSLVRMNDWNQYTVIAGLFGIEIEATTRVFVRSMWVKKLN